MKNFLRVKIDYEDSIIIKGKIKPEDFDEVAKTIKKKFL